MRREGPFRFSFMFVLMMAIWLVLSFGSGTAGRRLSKAEFETLLAGGDVEQVLILQNRETPTGEVRLIYKGSEGKGSRESYYVSDVNKLQEELEAKNIDFVLDNVPVNNDWLSLLLPSLITVGGCFLIFWLMQNRGGGTNAKMMNFGKSRARMTRDNKENFSSVAGLAEEKEDLEQVVDFLRDPRKYTEVGARIPKGIILVGPPGTGKTLLAKAVAGEAGVPFFSISGSDFVEMFVGVGASRVRDLFDEAKKMAPCIVFIDEIDAVARRRGSGLGGGHDEREQTLNQMLVEMDGFGVNEGIIVLAATNRPDILDPAILRPGRFDRKLAVGRPDVKGREAILKVHAKNKPIGDDVDLNRVARTTAGFVGADLENLLNEAAIITAKEGRKYIQQNDIDRAFVKVGIGEEKKSRVISEKEKKITAYHEAGHAILFHVLPDMGPVHTVSIIPTGIGAAGYTMPLPGEDEMFNTKGRMLQHIQVSLGGRIAEELIFGDVTTGASQDIKQATALAKSMVMQYGMSEKSYGEHMATIIDEEVKRIIDDCYAKAKEIIEANRSVLDRCAALLLEKEKIGQEEFEALFRA